MARDLVIWHESKKKTHFFLFHATWGEKKCTLL